MDEKHKARAGAYLATVIESEIRNSSSDWAKFVSGFHYGLLLGAALNPEICRYMALLLRDLGRVASDNQAFVDLDDGLIDHMIRDVRSVIMPGADSGVEAPSAGSSAAAQE